MRDPTKLRELASWYREFAERAANPTIWEGRLRMAEDLEAEARRAEGELGHERPAAIDEGIARRPEVSGSIERR